MSKLVVLVLSLLSVSFLAAPAGANPLYPTPDPDPFFTAPADIAASAPGDVVRTRRIDTMLYPGTEGWQVAFRSTNSAGDAIMGVTTVFMPIGVQSPPLVSYQALINSIGTRCNPSKSLFNGELQDAPGAMLPIGRGWAVSVPDYLGPTVAYGAARMSGMVTLDSVRAVQKVTELGLGGSPVALAGYSGGGMATAWAGALQPEYAPELKLAAVVAGGIPSDLELMADALGFAPHPGFGLAFAAAMGIEREYPDRVPVSDQLNETGLWFREFTKDACRRFLLFHGIFRNAEQMAASKELLSSQVARGVLRENSIVHYEGAPAAPTYIWQGRYDTLTPYGPVAETVSHWCGAGAPVKLATYDIAEHMTAAVAGFVDAWNYVESRFRDEPVPTTC
ncbi:lipase family protein [Nocardia caishijiensis]|uniref:Secretory lipase n=1 Tax=Nocardia caishijiensis TaxID=184756 RepID=A0ABQ6YT23_9NOCA|nr:lipase family protein [Nocardia caishijiensis]KAF0848967.1 secretory lipase [Nocardia caishijiensis]